MFALVSLVLQASACAGALPPAEDEGALRRRPDGVAIDPVSAPPPPRDRAEAGDALVTLRTPLGVDRAIATVDELFRKIVVEDAEGLEPLFTRNAAQVTTLSPTPGSGQTSSPLLFWGQRFRKLDYTKLAGETLYRDAELTIYRADDTVDAPPHPAVRPEALGGEDVVVRVPILVPRLGADRLFGDEMIVWLRRDGDRYRIYRIFEEFQLN